jgi:hypothetical protein
MSDLPTATFKWKDIFKATGGEAKDHKKVERININIWPFSGSRSVGGATAAGSLSKAKPNLNLDANASTTSAPPALAPALRKVSSALCSSATHVESPPGLRRSFPRATAVAAAADTAAAAEAPTVEEDATTA